MFRDRDDKRRPLARSRTKTLIWFDELSRLEQVLGYGGQLHSFEPVFGPRNSRGNPAYLWNRGTGNVDIEVAKHWKKYDIRLLLEKKWRELSPKLNGKLHVHVDRQDSFYLEGAIVSLKKTLDGLNSDAVVTIHPSFGHGTFMTDDFLRRTNNEMAERFLMSHPEYKRNVKD